jgi:hypothetical protein
MRHCLTLPNGTDGASEALCAIAFRDISFLSSAEAHAKTKRGTAVKVPQ